MNIIELAQECQLIGMRPHLDGIYLEALEAFAALVAAHEREACATIALDIGNATEPDDFALDKCNEIENAIRARGKS